MQLVHANGPAVTHFTAYVAQPQNADIIPLIPHMLLTCESHSSPALTASGGQSVAVHSETGDHDTLAAGSSGVRGPEWRVWRLRLENFLRWQPDDLCPIRGNRTEGCLRRTKPSAGPPGEVRRQLILWASLWSSAATFDSAQWDVTENLLLLRDSLHVNQWHAAVFFPFGRWRWASTHVATAAPNLYGGSVNTDVGACLRTWRAPGQQQTQLVQNWPISAKGNTCREPSLLSARRTCTVWRFWSNAVAMHWNCSIGAHFFVVYCKARQYIILTLLFLLCVDLLQRRRYSIEEIEAIKRSFIVLTL